MANVPIHIHPKSIPSAAFLSVSSMYLVLHEVLVWTSIVLVGGRSVRFGSGSGEGTNCDKLVGCWMANLSVPAHPLGIVTAHRHPSTRFSLSGDKFQWPRGTHSCFGTLQPELVVLDENSPTTVPISFLPHQSSYSSHHISNTFLLPIKWHPRTLSSLSSRLAF